MDYYKIFENLKNLLTFLNKTPAIGKSFLGI